MGILSRLFGEGVTKALSVLVSVLLVVAFVPTSGVAYAQTSDGYSVDAALSGGTDPTEEVSTLSDGADSEAIVLAGDATIAAGGTYQLAEGASGAVTITTTDAVTIVGNGVDISEDGTITSTANAFTFDATPTGGNANITLQDAYLSLTSATSVFDFTGEGNVLTIAGVCDIDYDAGYATPAAVHVAQGSSLTVAGTGTLYLYKNTQGAGFGGNSGELNGDITFGSSTDAGPSVFSKGTRQGALIGAGANASGATAPGSVSFLSGTYNLIANSRGAAVGGSAGTDGASAGTVVTLGKAASVNINVDFTGAAIGGGGYDSGNDASGGTLYVGGGSLRVYIDANAAGRETGWNGTSYTEGVNDVAITAQRLNNATSQTAVYKCAFDTSLLSESATQFTVQVDGEDFYTGGLHGYSYVQETLIQSEQVDITSTPSNWVQMTGDNADTNLYLYLTGTNHAITVNGQEYQAAWDETTQSFTVAEAQPESWYDAEATELTISTADELAQMAAIVNGTDTTYEQDFFAGKTVTLAADLDLSAYADWTPIGDATYAFAGTFDGAGHAITGLAITDATGGYHGLFGNSTGTVKDFSVTGTIGTASTYITSGSDNVGGAVGYNDGIVSGVTGNVSVYVNTSSIYAVGGVVGQNGQNGTVTQCSNAANVQATKAAGGVVGRSYGTVTECFNTGDIAGNGGGKDGIGGIVGIAGDKNSTYQNSVVACYNTGTISNSNGRWHGGIAGMADSASTVQNCYDVGAIASGYSWQWNPIIGCVDYYYSTVSNNYSLEGLNAGDTTASTMPNTIGTVTSEADFKSADMPAKLNVGGTYFVADSTSINNGYPVLAWQVGTEPEPESWYDPEATELTISTADELAQLSDIVRGVDATYAQDDFSGKTVTLAADLDLSGYAAWNPIGGSATQHDLTLTSQEDLDAALEEHFLIYDNTGQSYVRGSDKNGNYDANRTYYWVEGAAFAGTFDGAGHSIIGLTVNTTEGYAGLFGCVSGTVKDFAVEGSVTSTTTADFVGGAVGKLNAGGTIDGVTSNVAVTANSAYNVGGVVGFVGEMGQMVSETNLLATVSGCANYGAVSGNTRVGGIAGRNAGLITGCANHGTVFNGSGAKKGTGGIVGMNGTNNDADDAGIVEYCYNDGFVDANNGYWTGGIAGFQNSASTTRYCYNAGLMDVATSTGGQLSWCNPIVGQNEGTASDCVWLNEDTGDNTANYVGRDESGVGNSGGTVSSVAGMSRTELQSDAALLALNVDGRHFAKATEASETGFPVLAWESDVDATVESVDKASDPAKTSYAEGETFDATGLSLVATYTDGTKATVTDYTISNTGALTAADASVTVSGTYEGYDFSIDIAITVEAAVISVDAPTAVEGLVYNGSEQVGVAAGEGYTVSGGSATDAGDYTATATLAEGYAWSDGTTEPKTVSWSIAKAGIASAQVAFAKESYPYTGLPLTPAPTVTLGGVELEVGTDYTVAYADNIEAGTATVTVTGAGSYTGSVAATFEIAATEAPSYSDVVPEAGGYYLAAVEWAGRAGVMTGYAGSDEFGVGDTLTRDQLAILLWRYAEPEEAASYDAASAVDSSGKSDALSGQDYTAAVNWAVSSGVMNGYAGSDEFGVGDPVTFEQLVSVLVNYQVHVGNATAKGVAEADASALEAFSDSSGVSAWALQNVAWGYANGMFGGYDLGDTKEIRPAEDVARERCAAVLYNLCAAGLLPTA